MTARPHRTQPATARTQPADPRAQVRPQPRLRATIEDAAGARVLLAINEAFVGEVDPVRPWASPALTRASPSPSPNPNSSPFSSPGAKPYSNSNLNQVRPCALEVALDGGPVQECRASGLIVGTQAGHLGMAYLLMCS